jgi:hypothetical protein
LFSGWDRGIHGRFGGMGCDTPRKISQYIYITEIRVIIPNISNRIASLSKILSLTNKTKPHILKKTKQNKTKAQKKI